MNLVRVRSQEPEARIFRLTHPAAFERDIQCAALAWLNPMDISRELERGQQLADLGALEEALTCYKRIVSQHPDVHPAWLNQGFLPHATNSVKSKAPNEWGLWHMHGNVAEWCANPTPSGKRVVRGGSFRDPPLRLRASHREFVAPDERRDSIGFRICADAL